MIGFAICVGIIFLCALVVHLRHWGWLGFPVGCVVGIVAILFDLGDGAMLGAGVSALMAGMLPKKDGLAACAVGPALGALVFLVFPAGHTELGFFWAASGVGLALGGAVSAAIGYLGPKRAGEVVLNG